MGGTEAYWQLMQAFSMWSEVSSLSFHDVGDSQPADIDVSFVSGHHNDGAPFDGQGHVLAHAFPPGTGRGGDVHFDDDESWSADVDSGTNLLSVAAHEIGHALGISHSSQRGSLMFAWYDRYNPILQLHTDDIRAIQHLYGAKGSSTRHPAVIPQEPSTTPLPRTWLICRLDAITTLRGEVFAFKGPWAWRMSTSGFLKEPEPIAISSMWRLPRQLDVIDAIFERPGDGVVVIFRGKRFWEFEGHELVTSFPESGLELTELGIDASVPRIDAAAVGLGNLNRRVYLFSGYEYWRLRQHRPPARMSVDRYYPQEISSVFRGVPPNVDSAFTNVDGGMYFFKDDSYYLFSGKKLDVEHGYPKLINDKWTFCSENLRQISSAAPLSGGTLQLSIVHVTLIICVNWIMRLPLGQLH